MSKHETRSFSLPVEAKNNRLMGLIPYNARSQLICENGKRFIEVMDTGAIQPSGDVRALADHKTFPVYGRTSAGTLKLQNTPEGLAYDLTLADRQADNDLYTSVQRKDIQGVSFRFSVNADGESWDKSENPPVRHLRSIDVDEVSFVGNPAYTDTTVAARSMEPILEQTEQARVEIELELERILIEEQN